ncbi:MAG TPA: hypothetical protein VL503_03365 [Candidatus Omnitrophota bacterium]|nr:hypothetical protein [Candidatus Omnitrophota bacterium]
MRRLPQTSVLILLAAAALALPAGAPAQSLKLASLRVFHSDVVGPWVSYHVRTQSGRTPVREFTQRVAIVSREKVGKSDGYWVELKTVDRAGTRIERGLFAPGPPPSAAEARAESEQGSAADDADSESVADAGKPLRLVRYQMLAPGGKLYEYPIASAMSQRAGGEVSSYELFEFDPSVRPVRRFLGPDTVRAGRWVVPSVIEWTSRAGTDDWPMMEDSTSTYKLLLTQTYWRNPAISITGFARSLFRVTTKKVPIPQGSTKPVYVGVDSTLAFAPSDTTTGPTSMEPGDGRLLSWTELTLDGIGADAVAEVTQTPEPAPVSDHGSPPALIR